ncbi:MAG: UvrD-helicase domain-containing protein, partial [Crocinitomicaceae bacterium]|nr:UvrD-helicase domain-containing protein [Crocinitomicaceae bacterium]
YEHFLLDEFQDTSHLQWINMIPLIHNSLATGNLNLIVGDGKQAIYRWRNGEVEQFTNLPNKILNPENIASLAEAEKQFAESGELKRLKKNFRSSPEIVHFNNHLFRKLSESLAPDLQYIYHELEQEPVKKFPGYVEANFRPELTSEQQLEYTLDCVKRAVETGFRLKDICILVRKNDKGALLADFLTKNGIDVISPDSLFISKDLSVKLIFSMMCAAAVPSQKNFKIKTIEHYSSLILKQDPAEKTEQFSSLFNKKTIEEIFELENYQFKKYTDFPNLYDYVYYLIETFQLDLLQNPYLQFLLEEVHLFEKRVNPGIRDFIDWFREKGMEHSIISPEGSNAVQVMTIFKAKGLEFPVVICPFFDWRFELNRQISWVENESGKLPAYFVNITSKIKETEISGVYKEEESKYYLDQLNLLYVAFTRPEMALFISGDSKKPSTPVIHWLDKYFKTAGFRVNEKGCYFSGTLVRSETGKKSISPNYQITENYPKLKRIQMSFKSGRNWNTEDSEMKRTFGNKLHQILSKIRM